MKIIIISNRAYRTILSKLADLEKLIGAIRPDMDEKQAGKGRRKTKATGNPVDVYIDGEKVCELLCISGRTLLRLCKSRQLSYTRVSHRCYYPLAEVEKLFASRSIAFHREVKERLERELKRLKDNSGKPNCDELP